MTESWAPPDYSKLLAALLLFSCWGCTSPAPRYVVDMRTSPFSCFVQLGSSASPVSCDGLVLHEGDIITFRYEQATDFVDEHGRMPVLWSLWGDNDASLFTAVRYYTRYYSAKWERDTGIPASAFRVLIVVGVVIVVIFILGFVLLR